MGSPQIVVDTNVLVASLRSQRGMAHRLISLIGTGLFDTNITVALFFEYQATSARHAAALGIAQDVVDAIISFIGEHSIPRAVYFNWRPFLSDPKDDMVLEAAVSASAESIVTFNKSDFLGCASFGIRVETPFELLSSLGIQP